MSLIRLIFCYFYIFMFGTVRFARWRGVIVGSGCRIYTTSFGSEPFLIQIGDRVTVTSGVKFLTHDGSVGLVKNGEARYQKFGRVIVGNDVFIGVNSIVMPGVTIGSRVVIGAGSVVTRNVPDNSIVVGNPARVVGTYERFSEKVKHTCVPANALSQNVSYQEKVFEALRIHERISKNGI